MTEREELQKLRALLAEKERIIEKNSIEIEKRDRTIIEQEKLIEKQKLQIDQIILLDR